MTRERRRPTRRRVLARLGAAGAVGTVGWTTGVAADGALADTEARTAGAQVDDVPAEVEGEYAEIYREIIDGVVLVTVPGLGDEMPGGLGSGFVYDDQHVVTNDHVVGDAETVELQFHDEQWGTGSVVGTDVHSDLAVVEVEELPEVTRLSLTDGDPVIGQEVLALGNPLGFDASISQGIVSGVDRSLPSPTGFAIPGAIQTDAPVAPGNSGGPLVGLDGDVLGIVFAGAGENIAFAISARLADRVLPALIEDGTYDHPYVGIGVFPVGPVVAEVNDLPEPRGVLITDVAPDSPAEGTLEPATDEAAVDGQTVPVGGDVVVAIGDAEIPNQDRLSAVLALETSPGETVEIELVRDGERQRVDVTLDSRPDVEVP